MRVSWLSRVATLVGVVEVCGVWSTANAFVFGPRHHPPRIVSSSVRRLVPPRGVVPPRRDGDGDGGGQNRGGPPRPRQPTRREASGGAPDEGGAKSKLARFLTSVQEDAMLMEDIRVYTQTLLVCLTIRFFLLEPRYIPSLSMFPTFDIGDQLAVDKVTTKLTRPYFDKDAFPVHRNEVVVFKPPPAFRALVTGRAKDEALIKRCVAVAGDTLQIKQGVLYINGVAQDEDGFINERANYDLPPVTVPPGEVFVLGDNRNQSLDSHVWGFLPVDNIIGRAVFTYWPPSRIGTVNGT